jgi:parallel beta-helix repeat protein
MVRRSLRQLFVRVNDSKRLSQRHRFRPCVEGLEDRQLLASFSVPSAATPTIAAAVAKVKSGDTININPGTYTEQVVIPKLGSDGKPITGLTLQSTAHNATSEANTIIKAPSTLTGSQAVVDVQGATGVNILWLSITGRVNGLKAGVLVDQSGQAQIQNDTISNIGDATYNSSQDGVGVLVGGLTTVPGAVGSANVFNDTISGYQKAGVVANNIGSFLNVDNNTITGLGGANFAQYGIQVSNSATGDAQFNTITGNKFSNTTGTFSAAILLIHTGMISGPDATGGYSVEGNSVSSNDVGIWSFDSAASHIFNNSAFNNIYYGIALDSLDGTGNTAVSVEHNHTYGNMIGMFLSSINSTNGESRIHENDNINQSTHQAVANTFGIWLAYQVVNTQIQNNKFTANTQFGFLNADYDPNSPSYTAYLTTPSSSTGNNINGNTFTGNNTSHTANVFDAADYSVGNKTAGTADTWNGNTLGTKNPSGLK